MTASLGAAASVAGAWFKLHRGPAVILMAIFWALVTYAYAEATVTAFGRQQRVPMWALAPGIAVQITAVALTNQMAALLLPSRLLPRARGLWVVALGALTAMVVWPMARIEGDAGIVYAALIIFGISCGVAVVSPVAALVVGGVVTAVAIAQPIGLTNLSTWDLRVMAPSALVEVLVLLAVAGALAYAAVGPAVRTPLN